MDYKKEMLKLLTDLKKKNHGRRRIEKNLGYADKSLDQILHKGGNESIINKLREYKNEVEAGNIPVFEINEGIKEHIKKTKSQNPERALITMLIEEMAVIKSKLYGISYADAKAELDKNTRIVLHQIEEGL